MNNRAQLPKHKHWCGVSRQYRPNRPASASVCVFRHEHPPPEFARREFPIRLDCAARVREFAGRVHRRRVVRHHRARARQEGDAALCRIPQRLDRWTPASARNPARRIATCARRPRSQRFALDSKPRINESAPITSASASPPGSSPRPMARCSVSRSRRSTVLASMCRAARRRIRRPVLMNAVAAKVAGVGEIIMVTPTPDGVRNETVPGRRTGRVDRVFAIGGAQAVAALAYGTEASVPQWTRSSAAIPMSPPPSVRCSGVVGIDMVAGPRKSFRGGDDSERPDWLAMDLLSGRARRNRASHSNFARCGTA